MKSSQAFIAALSLLAIGSAACSAKVTSNDNPPPAPPVGKTMVTGTWISACTKDPNNPIYMRESVAIDQTKIRQQLAIYDTADCSHLLQQSTPVTANYTVVGNSAAVPGALDLDVDTVRPDGSHFVAHHLVLFEANTLFLEGTVYDGSTGRPISIDRSKPYLKQ